MDSDTLAMVVALAAIVLGSLTILIPIAGLTARYALKPWIDRLFSMLETRQGAEIARTAETVRLLEQRVALLEQEVTTGAHQLQALAERAEFYDRLGGGPDRGASAAPSGPAGR